MPKGERKKKTRTMASRNFKRVLIREGTFTSTFYAVCPRTFPGNASSWKRLNKQRQRKVTQPPYDQHKPLTSQVSSGYGSSDCVCYPPPRENYLSQIDDLPIPLLLKNNSAEQLRKVRGRGFRPRCDRIPHGEYDKVDETQLSLSPERPQEPTRRENGRHRENDPASTVSIQPDGMTAQP